MSLDKDFVLIELSVSVQRSLRIRSLLLCLDCPLSDLSPSLVEMEDVCGRVSGGGGVTVCYTGYTVGSVAIYHCDNKDYTLQGEPTRECLSSGIWNGTAPTCQEIGGILFTYTTQVFIFPSS